MTTTPIRERIELEIMRMLIKIEADDKDKCLLVYQTASRIQEIVQNDAITNGEGWKLPKAS